MSKYVDGVRNRGRSLLIVEGEHERNKLFWLIFKCFPEINIDMDDVWIYGTNIYMLYEDIVKEYGTDWAEDEEDIDLPFVISKKLYPDLLCYKDDFINIILVFDYERHDSAFSERKILAMQKCFADAADMGKLYINYPMIESYQHLKTLPDHNYVKRKVPVSLQPGRKYKVLVHDETVIQKTVEFPHRIDDLLNKHYGIHDEQMRKECCNAVLSIDDRDRMDRKLQEILQCAMKEDKRQKTLKYQLKDWIIKLGYINENQSYWEYICDIFKQIIYHNICKAYYIQNGQYQIEMDRYKKSFEELDLVKILKIQNVVSQDRDRGYIWVLNTCVLFVAEYNFALVKEHLRRMSGQK